MLFQHLSMPISKSIQEVILCIYTHIHCINYDLMEFIEFEYYLVYGLVRVCVCACGNDDCLL